MQPVQIGYALAGSGAVGTVVSLSVFPYLQRRFNNRRMYTFFSAFWAMIFVIMPIGNIAARLSMGGDQHKQNLIVWAAIALILTPLRIAVIVGP